MIANSNLNIFWPWVTLGGVQRPSRLTPKDQKDENYDSNCARYYLASVWSDYRNFYLKNYAANMRYAAGGDDAWGEAQDIKEFLGGEKDPSGRLALKNFVLQPMHTRLVGAADNISIDPSAEAVTQFTKTRYEAELSKMLVYSMASQAGPMMASAYEGMGVSPDEDQTAYAQDLNYQDEYVKAMGSLLTMMGNHQKMDKKKRQAASNIALSGLFAWHAFPSGSHIEGYLPRPEEVGWDTTATQPDFSDGSFCYIARQMDVSDIAEQFQASKDKLKELDRWANMEASQVSGGNIGWPQKKPRVITTYYKDRESVERGFVMKDGEEIYVTINVKDPASRDEKPVYTDKDLVKPPDNEFTVTWTDAEIKAKKQTREIETVRYCTMIPWEYLPGPFTEGKPYKDRSKIGPNKQTILGPTGDMILESGEYPLQEADPDQEFRVQFPLKFQTWTYMGGLVLAPLSAARDPQRMMNMVISDIVYRMERAGIPSVGLDSDATAGAGNKQADIIRALKDGKPYFLKGALVGGIQNAVTVTDTSVGASFFAQWQILEHLYDMAQKATGIYDQNYGAPGSSDQLVGTKKLQLQQAGVMMQPFYAALSDGFEQVHQFNAQAGKRFYCARPWTLKQWTGDMGAKTLEAAKDLNSESFRVKVTLTVDSAGRKKEADMMILGQGGYMDRGLLDAQAAAELLDRSYAPDIADGARKFTKRMAQAQQQQAQAQQQQQQQAEMGMRQQEIEAQQAQLGQEQQQAELENRKLDVKQQAPFNQAKSRWLEPPELEAQQQEQPLTP